MKLPTHLDPTIVAANGKVIHVGKDNDGLVVVDTDSQKPVMAFDEIAGDENVVHIFAKFAPGTMFGVMGRGDDLQNVGSDDIYNSHELLIRRAEHEPAIPVDPHPLHKD
jgi:hypothetical protein